MTSPAVAFFQVCGIYMTSNYQLCSYAWIVPLFYPIHMHSGFQSSRYWWFLSICVNQCSLWGTKVNFQNLSQFFTWEQNFSQLLFFFCENIILKPEIEKANILQNYRKRISREELPGGSKKARAHGAHVGPFSVQVWKEEILFQVFTKPHS